MTPVRAYQGQLVTALKAGHMGSWFLDLPTGDLQSSNTCKANYGRGPDESFTYDDLAASILPDDFLCWKETVERAVAAGSDFEIEYRTRWPDHTVHWVLVRGDAITDADGRTVSLSGISSDITARKLGDLALERSERRQQYVLALSDALRPLADPQQIQVVASTMLGTHLGAGRVAYFEIDGDDYVVDQMYTNGLRPFCGRIPISSYGDPPISAYRQGRTFQSTDVTRDPRFTETERAAYAEMQIGSYIGVPVFKGSELVGGLTVQSATARSWSVEELELTEETAERTWAAVERARANAAMEETRSRFDLVREAVDVGFWFCDLPFDVLIWDHKVKEHFWLPADGPVTIETFYACLHPDDRLRTREAIDASITNRLPYDIEYRTMSPTGEEKWIRAIGRTFYDPAGHPTRFDGVTIDISALKRTQEQLRENDRRKDEFLAMLAHELRNPLAPIVTAARVLQHPGLDPSAQQSARDIIERQAQHLSRLVDDLLDVSRITQHKIALRHEVIDMSVVVSRAVEANRPLLDARRQHLTLRTAPGSHLVHGDLTRLVQVVSNLVNNASKYSDEDGQIAVEVDRDADNVVLRVRDDGMGISADLLPHVFELFTQAERSLDRSQGGLGLGLTLVRLLVGMHNGRVEAFSDGAGAGSEFVLRLPHWSGPATEATTPADHAVAQARTSLRVLVIEDHVDSAEILTAVLGLAGHDVRVAHDGDTGLALARAFAPDIVLCDIGLPGMSGYDVATALRAHPACGHVVLVALSGYGRAEDRALSSAAGFDAHLVKPADPDALLRLLQDAQARLFA